MDGQLHDMGAIAHGIPDACLVALLIFSALDVATALTSIAAIQRYQSLKPIGGGLLAIVNVADNIGLLAGGRGVFISRGTFVVGSFILLLGVGAIGHDGANVLVAKAFLNVWVSACLCAPALLLSDEGIASATNVTYWAWASVTLLVVAAEGLRATRPLPHAITCALLTPLFFTTTLVHQPWVTELYHGAFMTITALMLAVIYWAPPEERSAMPREV